MMEKKMMEEKKKQVKEEGLDHEAKMGRAMVEKRKVKNLRKQNMME